MLEFAGFHARLCRTLLTQMSEFAGRVGCRSPAVGVTLFSRSTWAHLIDGIGKPLALALHALLAGNLTFAG